MSISVTMKRNTNLDAKAPNGCEIRRRWVARDEAGTYIDMDFNRHDLKERLEHRGYEVELIGD